MSKIDFLGEHSRVRGVCIQPVNRAARFLLIAIVSMTGWSVSLGTSAQIITSYRVSDRATVVDSEWASAQDALAAPFRPENGTAFPEYSVSFGWPEIQNTTGYEVVLTLPGGKISVQRTERNWLNWAERLSPGEYSWQVIGRGKGGQVVRSGIRMFRVLAAENAFVVLPIDRLLVTARSLSHPRGFPRGAERSQLVESLDVERASMATRLFQRVDGRAAVASLTPDPGQAREGGAAVGLNVKVVTENESRAAIEAAFAWLISNEPARLVEAKRRAVNMARWDPRGSTGLRADDFLTSRYVVWTLALLYDWLYDVWSVEDRALLLGAIKPRMSDFFGELVSGRNRLDRYPFNPQGTEVLGALAASALLLVGDAPEAEEWFNSFVSMYINFPMPWGGTDGGFGNGSSYAIWDAGEYSLLHWDVFRWSLGVDLGRKAWAQNFIGFLALTLPPGVASGAFGDGAEVRRSEETARVAKAYSLRYPSEVSRWYAGASRGEDGSRIELLMAPRAEGGSAKLPQKLPLGAVFPSVGIAAMHSSLEDENRVSILFKSSPFGSWSHNHADQNSFTISAGGVQLAIDSGYYDWFGSPHMREWSKHTLAHNAITFNGGVGQSLGARGLGDKSARGRILRFEHGRDMDVVSGDATEAYGGNLTRAIRTMVYIRPNLVLVYDELQSDRERQWEWNLHTLERMTATGERNISARRAGNAMCVDMISGPNVRFEQDSRFRAEPQGRNMPDQWHGKFTVTNATRSARFIALIRIGCDEIAHELLPSGSALEVRVPGYSVAFEQGGNVVVRR